MGAIKYKTQLSSSIPPKQMYKAFVLDADDIVPKILPHTIKKVEILEGDGGVGTVKLITFGDGSLFKNAKQRVDRVDGENLTYSYSIIEGEILMDMVESISYDVKIEGSPNGGSLCKQTSVYYTKHGVGISEEQIKVGKAKAQAIFKAIEAYVLANPDAYA